MLHVILGIAMVAVLSIAARAQPAEPPGDDGTGVRGTVTDADTGIPIKGVVVKVVGSGETATTDVNGVYRLELTPGKHDVRVYYDIYEPKRARIIVRRGTPLVLDVQLSMEEESIEVVVIEVPAELKTEAGSLQVRKKATTVSDSLSAQEMSRSPDSSAAGAVKRVVSATVVGGRYVLVRGIGGRYMTTLLNGVPLPSPEPDKQAVPLDLFPTSLLANLNVAKSYSARAPGTFAGGTLMIETNEYPSEFTLKQKASTSSNSAATLSDQLTYSGGSLDFLGFDDGTRALPDSVPTDQPVKISADMAPETVEAIAEDFSNTWSLGSRTAYPNLSLGMTIGDTLKIDERKLGYLATASVSHKLGVRDAHVAKVRTVGDMLEYREESQNVRGEEDATVGGLVNLGYELTRGHELSLFGLYTHTGESTAERVTGYNETDGQSVDSSRLKFEERQLTFLQLAGTHKLPFAGADVRWQSNVAFTGREEPDTRDITYNVLADGRIRFKNEPGSGERFFSELSETSLGTGFDLTVPSERVTLRTGSAVQRNERSFAARRFRYSFVGSDPNVLFMEPEEMLSDANIGESFRFTERTLATDAYDASLLVFGAYTEAELQITDDARLIAGVRYEIADQEQTPGTQFADNEVDEDDITSRSDRDFLPALSGVYGLTDNMNLRAAYSYTLARPMFRELVPFLYFDYARRRSVSGNPALEETRIHNADLRWEWFATDTEVYAVSAFYKRFRAPIEQVIVSASGGDISFDNAASADSLGLEFEGRVDLSRISGALDKFRAQANVSVIRSTVELTPAQVMSQTSTERPLQGQSPYVVNAGIGYSNEALGLEINTFYNVFGPRISEVGFDSLPDTYEQPFHRLDITASKKLNGTMKLKFAGTNLLNQRVQLESGGLEIFGYRPGVALSASLEWSP